MSSVVLYIMSIRACNFLAQRSLTLDNTGNKYRALCMVYKSGPQPGAIVPPRKHLPKSGDTFGCHSGWEWVGRGQKKLLKSLQCTGQPPQQKLSGSNQILDLALVKNSHLISTTLFPLGQSEFFVLTLGMLLCFFFFPLPKIFSP